MQKTITVTAKSIADQLEQWRIANQDPSDSVYRFPGNAEEQRSNASERTVGSFLRVASRMPAVRDSGRAYTDEELGYE
jgi:hypothetical protein